MFIMPATIQTLDHSTQVALSAIWKEQVQECIANCIETGITDQTITAKTADTHKNDAATKIQTAWRGKNARLDLDAYRQMALRVHLRDRRRRIERAKKLAWNANDIETGITDDWELLEQTPFTKPFWGIVVNK